jgi:hypothetical protein
LKKADMEQVGVFTFTSVYHAMRAEKLLDAAGVAGKLIPIPRALSANCHGLGLVISVGDRERAITLLTGTGVCIEKNVVLSSKEL